MAMLESRDSPCGNVSMGIYTSGSGTLVSWKLGTQAVGSAVHRALWGEREGVAQCVSAS